MGFLFCATFAFGTTDDRPTIVFFGDSITAGYGLSASDAYPAHIQEKLNKMGRSVRVVNAGVSGDTSSGGVRRIDWVLRQRVDLCVVALGANDGLRGIDPAVTRANLITIIDRIRQRHPKTSIVLAGMKLPPNLGPDYVERFAAVFPSVAKEKSVPLIPFLLKDVAAHPELNQGDRVHPTAAGQKIIAETVWQTIGPLVAKLK